MRKYIQDFIRRGLVSVGFGPLVLAVIYLILYRRGIAQTLAVPRSAWASFLCPAWPSSQAA